MKFKTQWFQELKKAQKGKKASPPAAQTAPKLEQKLPTPEKNQTLSDNSLKGASPLSSLLLVNESPRASTAPQAPKKLIQIIDDEPEAQPPQPSAVGLPAISPISEVETKPMATENEDLSVEVSSLNNTMTMVSSKASNEGIRFAEEKPEELKEPDVGDDVPVEFTKEDNDLLRNLPKKECKDLSVSPHLFPCSPRSRIPLSLSSQF